jgi:type 1 glutamine amidotransferase
MSLTRRELLLAAGAAMLGPAAASRLFASERRAPKKVLFFTKSAGFEHSVIKRRANGELGMAEKILTEIGKAHNFEVVASKDGTLFNPDKIGEWDAFAFETTGVLTEPGNDKNPPMSADGKKAFLDAIADGKGFIGMHCATDTFHSKGDEIDPYIKMIGGEFIVHGSQQKVKLDISDPHFPGIQGFGSGSFEILDEWYALKNQPDDLHVILAHDMSTFKQKDGGNKCYDRPNFPETWARMHGRGRVFYTSMGHREDVWENPAYQGLLLGALGWVTGQTDVLIEPNATKVTPDLHKTSNA